MWAEEPASGNLDEWTASAQCCLCIRDGALWSSHTTWRTSWLNSLKASPSVQAHLFQNQQPTCIGRERLGRDHCTSNPGAGHRGCVMCCAQLRWIVLLNLKESEGLQRLPGWSAISTCTNNSHPVRCVCTFECKMPWKINKGRVCAVPGIPYSMCALLFP